jgi:hypothetical protein
MCTLTHTHTHKHTHTQGKTATPQMIHARVMRQAAVLGFCDDLTEFLDPSPPKRRFSNIKDADARIRATTMKLMELKAFTFTPGRTLGGYSHCTEDLLGSLSHDDVIAHLQDNLEELGAHQKWCEGAHAFEMAKLEAAWSAREAGGKCPRHPA